MGAATWIAITIIVETLRIRSAQRIETVGILFIILDIRPKHSESLWRQQIILCFWLQAPFTRQIVVSLRPVKELL
jgi:hypothetical protein